MASPLESFFLAHTDRILSEPHFTRPLSATDFGSERQNQLTLEAKWKGYIQEAALIVREIEPYIDRRKTILEVGGGIGLVYVWLRREGYQIHSIEPSGSGHEGYFELGRRLLAYFGQEDSGWHPLMASELGQLNQAFDFIFSHNVIEHLQPLDLNLEALRKALAPGGSMLHQFPNYVVPYEPHFGIPLIPFAPALTARFSRRLSRNPLWKSLNFVSTFYLQRWCRGAGLDFRLKRGHWFDSVLRLESDPEFGHKHQVMSTLFRWMKALKVLSLFQKMPDHLTTPVQAIIDCPRKGGGALPPPR